MTNTKRVRYIKQEIDDIITQQEEVYEAEEAAYRESIPEATEKWIKWGEENLKPEVLDMWKECVPIRLDDLYHGMELDCFQKVFAAYQEDKSIENIRKVLDDQNHSGMSYGLMCSLIYSFLDKELGEALHKSA